MEDEKPRRRRAAAISVEPERGLAMRVLMHSPKDTLAASAAVLVVIGIIANAVFLQAGRHPFPMFGSPATVSAPAPSVAPIPRTRPADADIRPAETKPADNPAGVKPVAAPSPAAAPRPPAAIPVAKNDPVADLIVSNRRIAAVQRALTDFGYGQLNPTGIAGPDTQAAIRKFEQDRKQPVTGKISDRLIRDLVVLTGRPIE